MAPDQKNQSPGSVSDQNREEQPDGLRPGHDSEDKADKHQGGAQERAEKGEHGGRVGGASEGSQATGNPRNAG